MKDMELKYTIDYYNGTILFYPHELEDKLNLSLENCKNINNSEIRKIEKQCKNNKIISPKMTTKGTLRGLRMNEAGKSNEVGKYYNVEFEKEFNELCSGATEIYIPKGFVYDFGVTKNGRGLELTLLITRVVGKYGSHFKTCRYFAYDKFEIYVK